MTTIRMHRAVIAGAGWVLFLAGCTAPSSWKRGPSYASAGVVHGLERFDLSEAEQDSGSDLDGRGATGLELRVGHRVVPLAEIELQGQFFDAFEIEEAGASSTEVDLWTLGVNLKLYESLSERWFPDLSERWCPYLLVGLGVVRARLHDPQSFLLGFEETAGAARGGIGLEAFVSDHLAWFVEGAYLKPFGDLDGLDVITLTVGLQWRF